MFNGNDRPLALADFLIEAQVLLTTAEECLTHLRLIHHDEDAIDCIVKTLSKLERRAKALTIAPIAGFCQTLRNLLRQARNLGALHEPAVEILKDCFSLLAWHVELIDPHTGQLTLDDSEQKLLITSFTEQIEAMQTAPPPLG